MKNNFSGVPREIKMILAFIVVMLLIGLFFWREQSRLKTASNTVTINKQAVNVQIADSEYLRYQGLSNQKKLCELCGMLFIFPDKKVENIVMRNMNFPLDVIYIDGNKIIKIDANILPEGENPSIIYSSELPVDSIIEVNSSFTDKYNINVGDEIIFNLQN